MKKTIFMLGLSVFAFACSKKTQVTKETTQTTVKEETKVVNTPKPTQTPTNTLVFSFKRTPCYGRCPTYAFQLFSDGKVTYNGTAYVELLGNYEAKVDENFKKQIEEYARKIDFTNLRNRYPDPTIAISDVPSAISFLKIDGEEKTITNLMDAPQQLIEFEHFIDDLFKKVNWQKAKE